MPRKQPVIRTESYVHCGDKLVRFDDLPPEKREQAARELKIRYLNALYQGQAVFREKKK